MGSHRTAPTGEGGFLDSIISAVSDFASSVISIPRRTVETVETLLFEPGSPGEAVGEVIDIFNPVQIARDLETVAAPRIETVINPDTGRPEQVERPSALGSAITAVGDFIRGAGEAAAGLLPAPSTVIIVLGIIAVIVVAVAVTAATT